MKTVCSQNQNLSSPLLKEHEENCPNAHHSQIAENQWKRKKSSKQNFLKDTYVSRNKYKNDSQFLTRNFAIHWKKQQQLLKNTAEKKKKKRKLVNLEFYTQQSLSKGDVGEDVEQLELSYSAYGNVK